MKREYEKPTLEKHAALNLVTVQAFDLESGRLEEHNP